MIICFMLLYFPIVKINQLKLQNPAVGTILGIIISLVIIILSIIYRVLILRLIPARNPSSK